MNLLRSLLKESLNDLEVVFDVLKRNNVLGSTVGETVRDLRNSGLPASTVKSMLAEITGEEVGSDAQENLMILSYIAQNAWRARDNSAYANPNAVVTKSIEDAHKMLDTHGWDKDKMAADGGKMSSMSTEQVAAEVKNTGNFRKGAKMALAVEIFNSTQDKKEIVARYMSELNMTKAGAYTYWHTLKKKLEEKQKAQG